MGRVVTPKYRMELEVPGYRLTPWAWEGRATAKRLGEKVRDLNQSCELGGSNHGAMPGAKVQRARLVRQADNRVVAEYVRDRGAWQVPEPYPYAYAYSQAPERLRS